MQTALYAMRRRSDGSATRDIVSQQAEYYTARRIRIKSPSGFQGVIPVENPGRPKAESNQGVGPVALTFKGGKAIAFPRDALPRGRAFLVFVGLLQQGSSMSALYGTYARSPLAFERGEGVRLFSQDGTEYLDFHGGVAVNALGHTDPHVVAALKAAADKVWH